jgi:ubiquinone/menaquinone biosynthesis C-methylase UbiE
MADDKEYWNKYWKENINRTTFFNSMVALARKYYFARAFANFIKKNYDIKNKSVCEIGVGSGLTLSYLKKMGAAKCTGVDYSEEVVNSTKNQIKDCEFILGDAFNLAGVADKQFDLVYSLGFLEHYNRKEQKRLLAEQLRIASECVFIEVPYNIFYFRWIFFINRKFGRTTTFSDEEMFDKKTFKDLELQGKSKLMPTTFFLTIGHFENLEKK